MVQDGYDNNFERRTLEGARTVWRKASGYGLVRVRRRLGADIMAAYVPRPRRALGDDSIVSVVLGHSGSVCLGWSHRGRLSVKIYFIIK